MAEWVRALACTGGRTVRVRIPLRTTSLRSFGNSVYPALPVSFGGDSNLILSKREKSSVPSIWCLCHIARPEARPGEVKDPTSPHWNV